MTPIHKLLSWWVTLPIIERNARLFPCIKPVLCSIKCGPVAENEGEKERERKRERRTAQFMSLSQQKQSVLSRCCRDTNQAGVIWISMSVCVNFCKCEAQLKIKILTPRVLHTTVFFCHRCSSKILPLHLHKTLTSCSCCRAPPPTIGSSTGDLY